MEIVGTLNLAFQYAPGVAELTKIFILVSIKVLYRLYGDLDISGFPSPHVWKILTCHKFESVTHFLVMDQLPSYMYEIIGSSAKRRHITNTYYVDRHYKYFSVAYAEGQGAAGHGARRLQFGAYQSRYSPVCNMSYGLD